MSSNLQKDLLAASVVQRRMLPRTHCTFAGITLTYELFSASSLSGDFVDFVELPDRHLVVLVADVAGHGAGAALVTVVLKSFMTRLTAGSADSPGRLLGLLNTELLAVNLDRHVSAVVGVVQLDTNTLTLACAGAYPLPLYWRSANTGLKTVKAAMVLELAGKALGLFEAPEYVESTLELAVGDRLTVVTDGVLEWLPSRVLAEQQTQLASAAAAPTNEFWPRLGVEPAAGGIDDATRFTLERHA